MKTQLPEVLICEESPQEFQKVEECLDGDCVSRQTKWARDQDAFFGLLKTSQPHVFLLSTRFCGWTAGETLAHVRADHRQVPKILLADPTDEPMALDTLKQGADDYVLKPNYNRLGASVRRALRENIDIEVQEKMATQLIEQEGFYLSLVENIPFKIFRKDLKGRFTFVNKWFCELVGRAPEHIIGRTDFDLFPPALARKYQEDDQRVMRDGNILELIEENRLPGGEVRYVKVVKVQLINSVGNPFGVQGIFWDITEAKLARDKIEHQARLLDQVKDAIVVAGPDGNVRFWNQAAERLYGRLAADAVGQHVIQAMGLDREVFLSVWRQLLDHGEWEGGLWQKHKEGRVMDVNCRYSLSRDERGRIESLMMVNTDVTGRKKLEEQIGHLNVTQNLNQLSRSIAHDLRNILSPVLAAAGRLRQVGTLESLKSDDYAKSVSVIEESVEMGTALLEKLAPSGSATGRRRVDLRPVVQEFSSYLARLFPPRIRLKATIAEEVHLVKADTTQIRQVLLNLVINARDAIAGEGLVQVELENLRLDAAYFSQTGQGRPGSYVTIRVTDNGTGIPADIKDKIFQPYFTTKSPGQATGLGLSTVSRIAYEHGGFVRVVSQINKGTTFHVFLPALNGGADTEEDASLPATRHRVLVADDDPQLLALTEAILEHANYDVETVPDGTAAVEYLARPDAHVDLLLTDLRMPVMNGVELVREVRRRKWDLPIVLMTGYDVTTEFPELSQNLGVRHFLPKPFSQDLLVTTVARAIQEATSA